MVGGFRFTRGTRALTRLATGLAAILLAASLGFWICEFAPGDAALALTGEAGAAGLSAEIARASGADAPAVTRWLGYLAGLPRGELGWSLREQAPVASLILERAPVTLALTGASALLAAALGVLLGALAPRGAAPAFAALHALPAWLVGQGLVLGFAVGLGWLPVQGSATPAHFALPVLALALHQLCLVALLMEAGTAREAVRPYVVAARARGRSRLAARLVHAAPNALAPVLAVFGVRLGALLGGAAAVETVFALPGLGRLAVTAALARDTPVVLGLVVVATAAMGLATALFDALARRFEVRA